MIIIKSPPEIEAMRRAGAMVGQFFEEVERHVRSGVATRVRDGFFGDAARTYAVGKISAGSEKLLATTERALTKAIGVSLQGNRLGDISAAIQEEAGGGGVLRGRG